MLVISTQNWSILAKFAKKNPAKSAVFYWLFLGEVCPRNFPWNRPIFLRICPWKSFEIWLFSAKIPRKRTIFRRILTFLPWNWPIFPRILTFFPRNRPIFPRICPWKSREILLFFPRNIRSPDKSTVCSVCPKRVQALRSPPDRTKWWKPNKFVLTISGHFSQLALNFFLENSIN